MNILIISPSPPPPCSLYSVWIPVFALIYIDRQIDRQIYCVSFTGQFSAWARAARPAIVIGQVLGSARAAFRQFGQGAARHVTRRQALLSADCRVTTTSQYSVSSVVTQCPVARLLFTQQLQSQLYLRYSITFRQGKKNKIKSEVFYYISHLFAKLVDRTKVISNN